MKPSFFTLFKRGKYFHRADDDIWPGRGLSREQKRKMQERERYAVAALGFCLKHCPRFGKRFYKLLSTDNGYPRDPPIERPRLEVEPFDWADLLILSNANGKRFVYVIECKIGAFLKPHQNPAEDAFWLDKQKGYGARLCAQETGSELRFCVLGYPTQLKLGPPPLCILPFQKSWKDIENCWPGNNAGAWDWQDLVLNDLFESLGRLDIQNFKHRETNNMKIRTKLDDAARAFRILGDTSEKLRFIDSRCKPDIRYQEETDWYVGIDVKKLSATQGKSVNQRRLAEIVTPPTDFIAWFGYIADKAGKQELAVNFNCGGRRRAERLLQRLKPEFPKADIRHDKDDGTDFFNVVVRTKVHKFAGDRDWFLAVFRKAGLEVRD